MKIISVAGARPNFMKIAPLHKAFLKHAPRVRHLICHTGQHYDANMSEVFFRDLELPKPDFYLGAEGGSHAGQTAKIMTAMESILLREKPDLVIVVGDVNSTLACGLVAAKMDIPVAHVEAGLRSFDRTMPEEINRRLTDALSSYMFVTEPSGMRNLKKEGVSHFLDGRRDTGGEKSRGGGREIPLAALVGNVMIDCLIGFLPKIGKSKILRTLRLDLGRYILVTFHRPNNVDSEESLRELISFLNALGEKRTIVFPVHPRTRLNLGKYGLEEKLGTRVIACEPIGYIDFLALETSAELVITDSGGIQEETTFLGVPCLTVRDNTERPITIRLGTNQLVGTDLRRAEKAAFRVLEGRRKEGKIPPLWDGRAAERIVAVLSRAFGI